MCDSIQKDLPNLSQVFTLCSKVLTCHSKDNLRFRLFMRDPKANSFQLFLSVPKENPKLLTWFFSTPSKKAPKESGPQTIIWTPQSSVEEVRRLHSKVCSILDNRRRKGREERRIASLIPSQLASDYPELRKLLTFMSFHRIPEDLVALLLTHNLEDILFDDDIPDDLDDESYAFLSFVEDLYMSLKRLESGHPIETLVQALQRYEGFFFFLLDGLYAALEREGYRDWAPEESFAQNGPMGSKPKHPLTSCILHLEKALQSEAGPSFRLPSIEKMMENFGIYKGMEQLCTEIRNDPRTIEEDVSLAKLTLLRLKDASMDILCDKAVF